MKIYLASSWRNASQPAVLQALRAAGHLVYDFRNPHPGNDGFSWRAIDGGWQSWSADTYVRALEHPVACEGFRLDMEALEAADATVLVLPCGRSAHLELGYARGLGQRTAVLLAEPFEPELMYRMVDKVCPRLEDLLGWLAVGAPANGQERYLHAARKALGDAEAILGTANLRVRTPRIGEEVGDLLPDVLKRAAGVEVNVSAGSAYAALAAIQWGLDHSRPPCPPEDLDDAPRSVFA